MPLTPPDGCPGYNRHTGKIDFGQSTPTTMPPEQFVQPIFGDSVPGEDFNRRVGQVASILGIQFPARCSTPTTPPPDDYGIDPHNLDLLLRALRDTSGRDIQIQTRRALCDYVRVLDARLRAIHSRECLSNAQNALCQASWNRVFSTGAWMLALGLVLGFALGIAPWTTP